MRDSFLFAVSWPKACTTVLYLVVCDYPEGDGGDVERVGHEVYHIPHVVHVLPQAHVPQLLDLAPYEPCHPRQDAALHDGGRRPALGRGVVREPGLQRLVLKVLGDLNLYPLGRQDEQNWKAKGI